MWSWGRFLANQTFVILLLSIAEHCLVLLTIGENNFACSLIEASLQNYLTFSELWNTQTCLGTLYILKNCTASFFLFMVAPTVPMVVADVGYVVHGLAKFSYHAVSSSTIVVSVVGAKLSAAAAVCSSPRSATRTTWCRPRSTSQAPAPTAPRAEPKVRPAFSKTGRGATKSLVDNPKIITTAAYSLYELRL